MIFKEELERISLLESLGYGEDLIESINESIENNDKSVFGTFSTAAEALKAAEEAINGKAKEE